MSPLKGNTDLEWADVALVGAMMVQLPSAKKIVERAREAGKIVTEGARPSGRIWSSSPMWLISSSASLKPCCPNSYMTANRNRQ
jgi:hypothetical protein